MMKKFLLAFCFLQICSMSSAQTTWQVCVEDPPSSTCPGKTGTFTPGNLVIQQGDMIQFTTTMVLLGGYTGTFHDIQFTGSPANNVMLLVSSDIFNQVTTVTTPPFTSTGVFPMECVDFAHCILSEYACTGYSVTVLPLCSVTASFSPTSTTVCAGDIVNFTNTSSGATSYTWHLDEFTYSTSTNSVLSFGTAGSYDIELIADDGAGCLDSVTITIDVDQNANAGTDENISFCNIDDSVDLNTIVTGDSGGSWTETTSSGQFNAGSGMFNYNGLAQSTYLFDYIVLGQGVCPNDTSEMSISINQQPEISLNISPNNVDISDSTFVDFTATGVLSGGTYLWSFCDGNLSTVSSPFYNSWASVGNYCVCVTLNNGNGCLTAQCDSTITVFDASGLLNVENSLVKLYPNPTTGVFKIDLSVIQKSGELVIFDSSEKQVYSQKTSPNDIIEIDSNRFPDGIYFVKLIIESEQTILPVVFK